jgi:hypothetical protein
MITDSMTALAGQVEAALIARRHLLPNGFAAGAAAARIAACYAEQADGTSGFWIARPRWTGRDGVPMTRAVYEVLRSDGCTGVWDAVTLLEGEVIADALTCLSW